MVELFEGMATITVIISVLLAVGVLMIYPRLTKPLKIISIYLIVGASIDVVSLSLAQAKQNNLLFLHLFTILELIILSTMFSNLFAKLKSKLCMNYFIAISAALVLFNSIFIQKLNSYNTYSSTLVSLIILGYCIYYFYLSLDKTEKDVQVDTLRLIIASIFIYHSASVMIMFFGNLISVISKDIQTYIWLFRCSLILMMKITIVYAFSKLITAKLSMQKT